jgi:hypothetical protein
MMTTTKHIPRDQWSDFFHDLTFDQLIHEPAVTATIESLTAELGDQIAIDDAPLLGVTWDARAQALDFLFEDVDHFARDVAEVYSIETDDGVVVDLEIVHRDGAKELVHIRRGDPADTHALP